MHPANQNIEFEGYLAKGVLGIFKIIRSSDDLRDLAPVSGHFTFKKDGTGHFHFGLVQGEMDCCIERDNGRERIKFSWEGQEELGPANGRGWAVIENEELHGRIFFHQGDDSVFRARGS